MYFSVIPVSALIINGEEMYQIEASGGDCVYYLGNEFNVNAPTIALKNNLYDAYVGLVFGNVTRVEAEIDEVYLSIYVDGVEEDAYDYLVSIYGVKENDVSYPVNASELYDWDVTSESVTWNLKDVEGTGWFNSTNLIDVWNDLSYYNSGENVGLIVYSQMQNYGSRYFVTYDGNSSYAPRLYIKYKISLEFIQMYEGYSIYRNVPYYTGGIDLEELPSTALDSAIWGELSAKEYLWYDVDNSQWYFFWGNSTDEDLWYSTRPLLGTWRDRQELVNMDGIQDYTEYDSEIGWVTNKLTYAWLWYSSPTQRTYWRQGDLNSDGSVSWDDVQDITMTINNYPSSSVNVEEDSEGYQWIWHDRDYSLGSYWTIQVNTRFDGVWVDDWKSDFTTMSATNSYYTQPTVTLRSTKGGMGWWQYNDMDVGHNVMVIGDNVKLFDSDDDFVGEDWNCIDFCPIVGTDKVGIAHWNDTDNDLYFTTYDYSDNSYGDNIKIFESGEVNKISPSLSCLDNGRLVVFWSCDGADYPDNNKVWALLSDFDWDYWTDFEGQYNITYAQELLEDLDGLGSQVHSQRYEEGNYLGLLVRDDTNKWNFIGVEVYDIGLGVYYVYDGGTLLGEYDTLQEAKDDIDSWKDSWFLRYLLNVDEWMLVFMGVIGIGAMISGIYLFLINFSTNLYLAFQSLFLLMFIGWGLFWAFLGG